MPRQNVFAIRIRELEDAIERLRKREREGWYYKRVRVKATTVKAHRRKSYWVMRLMRRKPR